MHEEPKHPRGAMTNRERMLAILEGKSPDRIPWMPRIRNWYNARRTEGDMPARFQGMSEEELGHALRIGNPALDGHIFRARNEGIEVQIEREADTERTSILTPHGAVTMTHVVTAELQGRIGQYKGITVEHPIKEPEDYRIWEYIVEHTYYDPCYEEYLAYERKVGDDGYPMVATGDSPFHNIALELVGYGQAYYHLMDHTNEYEHLMAVMTQVDKERLWPVVANSPARLITHGKHYDTQITPPRLFSKYITPYYKEFTALLHSRGKKLAWHSDNDAQAILGLTKEAGFDMAEHFCTAPMVEVTLEEARQVYGTEVILWGGIPSIVLEPSFPEEKFEEYVRGVFRTIAPGDAFVMGVSDTVMSTSVIERVERISELIERYGNYPVQPY